MESKGIQASPDVVGPERKEIHSFTTEELLDELSGRAEVECASASSRDMTVCVASAGPCLVLKVNKKERRRS